MRAVALAVAILGSQAPPLPPPTQPAAPTGAPQALPKPPEFPNFADVTRDLEVRQGYYTLYQKGNRLLAEIPPDKLNRPFLLATSFARGTYSGWMWDEFLVQWTRVDRKLMLIEPEVRHRARPDDPLAASVKRNYTESVILSTDILTLSPSGGPVIDLFMLLAQRAPQLIGPILGGGFGMGMRAGGVDPMLVKIHQLKSFPSNFEIEIDLPPFGRGPITTVHFSFSELKETGYRARIADDRVGYFITSIKDYSKSAKDDTRFVRYVNRWQIQKADAKLKLSPPKDPIIFYIEKTVPVQYRRAVRDGILEWNKAFEKIGISEAIVARQQTADNEFRDLDPEDVRYNFFRWITSDRAFAMGPSRVDPRTGQILDADIIFDDAMIRAYLQEHKLMIGESARARLSPAMRAYLDRNPNVDPTRAELPADKASRDEVLAGLREREAMGLLEGNGQKACSLGRGILHQMSVAQLAGLALTGEEASDKWPEEFIDQIVKEIVMHEVGHTLGLRHNFKASSFRSVEDMLKGDAAPVDSSGSVMDYNPVWVPDDPKKPSRYLPGTIGPYDYWAIEYGYKPIEMGTPEAEKPELDKVAKRVADKGLAYGTDEDVWSSDPLIERFDFGSDPLAYSVERMKLVQQIQEKLIDRAVRPGDSYSKARRAFMVLLFERLEAEGRASRHIGGNSIVRDHRGDPNERLPITPIPAETQRQALAFLRDHIFADQAYRFSPDFLNKLGASRWRDWGREFDAEVEFPIHDYILNVQRWAILDVFNPETFQRVLDAELRIPKDKDALTLPELISTMTQSIASEVLAGPKKDVKYSERQPYISSLRRNLQREYFAHLIEISLESDRGFFGWGYPRTAKTLVWHEMKVLHDTLNKMLTPEGTAGLDRYSLSHLEESRQRIRRALDAAFSIGGGGGGFFFGGGT